MTRLRKEKEGEIFQEFQTHQQRMCDCLHHQMQQMKSDEDGRIAKAVTEQEAKREVSDYWERGDHPVIASFFSPA